MSRDTVVEIAFLTIQFVWRLFVIYCVANQLVEWTS